MADMEEMKMIGSLPISYLGALEMQFLEWYEAEGNDEELSTFRLHPPSGMYHLEWKKDALFLKDQLHLIEYVDYEKTEDCSYYRVGLMKGHQMSLVYFLEGTLGAVFEQWLQNGEDEEDV